MTATSSDPLRGSATERIVDGQSAGLPSDTAAILLQAAAIAALSAELVRDGAALATWKSRVRSITDGAESAPRSVRAADVVFKNGRRPSFWFDIEVREAVLADHRQMTVEQFLTKCTALFGPERTPSKSAVARIWKQIDDMKRGRGAW